MSGEHDLLLRHFDGWIRKTGREADLPFLEEALHLRATYDDLEATYWPAGSIEHLLTERWPAKGSVDTPDAATVAATLESFGRFLRNTGRLASGSVEPAALAKEARRSAKRMVELAGDRASWSFTKQLMEFGSNQGISFDDVPDVETMRARLDEVTQLWNSLPIDQRRALSPRREDIVAERDISGRDAAMQAFGVDDPIIALLLSFGDRLPTGRLPDEQVVAPYVSGSAYAQRMLQLAQWVGDGKEITATTVLRPTLAREAYDALGLGDWQLDQLRRAYPDERLPGVARVGRDAWIAQHMEQRWRSAADCEELHRLWLGAVGCGLVRLDGKRAEFSGEGPPDAERWVNLGVRAVVAMASSALARPFLLAVLAYGLVESYVGRCTAVSKRSMLDFLVDWNHSPATQREMDGYNPDWRDRHYGPYVENAAGMWADTGLYVEDADSITLTPFGDVFLTAWLKYLER